jgi:hypothetical protein
MQEKEKPGGGFRELRDVLPKCNMDERRTSGSRLRWGWARRWWRALLIGARWRHMTALVDGRCVFPPISAAQPIPDALLPVCRVARLSPGQ